MDSRTKSDGAGGDNACHDICWGNAGGENYAVVLMSKVRAQLSGGIVLVNGKYAWTPGGTHHHHLPPLSFRPVQCDSTSGTSLATHDPRRNENLFVSRFWYNEETTVLEFPSCAMLLKEE